MTPSLSSLSTPMTLQIKKKNEEEVALITHEIKRLGKPDANGNIVVKFGTLFKVRTVHCNQIDSDVSVASWGSRHYNLPDLCLGYPLCLLLSLLQDDKVANTFEGLAATLKNAKTRKILTYASPLLLQGAHDNVDIVLAKEHVPAE